MGFERPDNQPTVPEWPQLQQHAARSSIEAAADQDDKSEKSKKKKKKGQADYQEREHRREAKDSAAILGSTVLAPGEIWSRAKSDKSDKPEKTENADKAGKAAEHDEADEANTTKVTTKVEAEAAQKDEIDEKDGSVEIDLDETQETEAAHEAASMDEAAADAWARAAAWTPAHQEQPRAGQPEVSEAAAEAAEPDEPYDPYLDEAPGHRPYTVASKSEHSAHEEPARVETSSWMPVPESWRTAPADAPETGSERPGDVPPPVPPSFYDYERVMWPEREPMPAMAAAAATGAELPAAAPAITELAPGLQRSPADVSRAAWTGVIAGWFIGRRGKRKAVEQAHKAGVAEGTKQEAHRQRKRHAAAPEAARQVVAPALEATPLHVPPVHERPGVEAPRVTAVPLAVEARPAKASSTPESPAAASRPAAEITRPAPEATGNMKRGELLKIAKKIKVDGVRLNDVYSAKRIDQEGLRAVVESYLRGGDYQRQLSDEIVAKEQSFERDPYLRKLRKSQTAETLKAGVSSATVATRGLIQEKSARLTASSQKTAHKAGKMLANGARQAQHDLIDKSNSADWIGVTAIVVIYSLILILLFG